MKTKIILILIFFSLFTPSVSAFNPSENILSYHNYGSLKQLVQHSDMIGYGEIGDVLHRYPTSIAVNHGKLVNTIQPFQMNQVIKGDQNTANVMITGVEPLPDADDPLNQIYPGPLASGSYILFLKKIKDTNEYQLAGGWQGVYPIISGKSISLYGIGFKDLNQLTVDQFHEKLRASLP